MRQLLQVPLQYLPRQYVEQVRQYDRIGINIERIIPIAFAHFTRLWPNADYDDFDELFRAIYQELRQQQPELEHYQTVKLSHSLMDHIAIMQTTLVDWLANMLGRFDHLVRFEKRTDLGLLFSFENHHT